MSEKQPLVITKESHAVAILMGEAIDLCNERGKNYNAGRITKEDYNVFPLRYHAGEMHKEALRACSWVEQGNIAKVKEHVRDVVVWAAFLYEEASRYKELDEAVAECNGIEIKSAVHCKTCDGLGLISDGTSFVKACPDCQESPKAKCGGKFHNFIGFAGGDLCVCGHARGCVCHAKERLAELRKGMCGVKHEFVPNSLGDAEFGDYCDKCGHSRDSTCHGK